MTFCSKCGAKNPDDGMFCYKCGAELVREEAVESEPVAETVPEPEPVAETVTEPAPESEDRSNLKAYAWVCIILAYVVGAYFLFVHRFHFTSKVLDITSPFYDLGDVVGLEIPEALIIVTVVLFILTFTGYGGVLSAMLGFVITLLYQHFYVYLELSTVSDTFSFSLANLEKSLALVVVYAILCALALFLMIRSTAHFKADGKFFSGSIGAFYGFNKE